MHTVKESFPGIPERGEVVGALPPCLLKRGSEVPFHNSIIGIVMVYKQRLETN